LQKHWMLNMSDILGIPSQFQTFVQMNSIWDNPAVNFLLP